MTDTIPTRRLRWLLYVQASAFTLEGRMVDLRACDTLAQDPA